MNVRRCDECEFTGLCFAPAVINEFDEISTLLGSDAVRGLLRVAGGAYLLGLGNLSPMGASLLNFARLKLDFSQQNEAVRIV